MKTNFAHYFSHDWLSQYWRMRRWAGRAKIALNKKVPSEEELDDVYAFFVIAFSLKEWLVKSERVSVENLDKNIKNFKYWKICRDIANGVKHMELRAPSYENGFTIWKSNQEDNKSEYWFVLVDNKLWSLFHIVEAVEKFWIDMLTVFEEKSTIVPSLKR